MLIVECLRSNSRSGALSMNFPTSVCIWWFTSVSQREAEDLFFLVLEPNLEVDAFPREGVIRERFFPLIGCSFDSDAHLGGVCAIGAFVSNNFFLLLKSGRILFFNGMHCCSSTFVLPDRGGNFRHILQRVAELRFWKVQYMHVHVISSDGVFESFKPPASGAGLITSSDIPKNYLSIRPREIREKS